MALSKLSELKALGREMAWKQGKGGTSVRIRLNCFVFAFLLFIGLFFLLGFAGVDRETTSEIIRPISWLLEVIFGYMMMVMFLGRARKEDLKVSDFWKMPDWKKVGRMLLTSVCVGLLGFIGILLLIVPGIIIMTRLCFTPFAVVDKGLGFDAIKYSWKITKGHFWDIVVFGLYFFFWNIVGLLCLGIGVIWTSTMSQIAFAKLYYELSEAYDNQQSNA